MNQIKLCEILQKNNILIENYAENKYEIISNLVSSLIINDSELREKAFEAVVTREEEMSTAIGNGFAIPHAKLNEIETVNMAIAIIKEAVDFDSLDGEDVNIVLLVLSNGNELGQHIKVLSKASRVLSNEKLRNDLATAKSSEDVIAILEKFEN